MYKFETVIIAKILSMYVPDSILEALEGYEAYRDADYDNRIYNISDIELICNNPDEETDEELLYEMSRLVEAAKFCGAEKILIVM